MCKKGVKALCGKPITLATTWSEWVEQPCNWHTVRLSHWPKSEASHLELSCSKVEETVSCLTFVELCIVIYFYSKTNQMHNMSNLFYFRTTLYMFRTVSPSIIRNVRPNIQHHTIQLLWLLASKQLENLYGIIYFILGQYSTCFGRSLRPSSGV
jgi:hypothetical protein